MHLQNKMPASKNEGIMVEQYLQFLGWMETRFIFLKILYKSYINLEEFWVAFHFVNLNIDFVGEPRRSSFLHINEDFQQLSAAQPHI